eukprot:TRINITY_DN45051_c0_g1_i1.p1 TRINITY_DN45051_c0_g1~~TRINITY_DN45051_c0_g1_i1.p1  ORF type:complete len:216 (-),score=28.37 TRINITY_DN45051_c0_g1_i1:97-717(-)
MSLNASASTSPAAHMLDLSGRLTPLKSSGSGVLNSRPSVPMGFTLPGDAVAGSLPRCGSSSGMFTGGFQPQSTDLPEKSSLLQAALDDSLQEALEQQPKYWQPQRQPSRTDSRSLLDVAAARAPMDLLKTAQLRTYVTPHDDLIPLVTGPMAGPKDGEPIHLPQRRHYHPRPDGRRAEFGAGGSRMPDKSSNFFWGVPTVIADRNR